MKINPETRILLILGAVVLLGGGGMVAMSHAPVGPTPPPIPTPFHLTPAEFETTFAKARHVRGDTKKTRFTLLEFGDLQCPGCRGAYNAYLVNREQQFPIRFAFADFPLRQHERAVPAAEATEAAAKQGKFWEMFDTLYTGLESPLTDDVFNAAGQKIGLDMKRFATDRKDPALEKEIYADAATGSQISVAQTPTFFLRDDNTGQVYEEVGGSELDKKIAALTNTPPLPPPSNAPPQ